VKNVKELLDHVAANPGKLNSASSNSAAELAMVQLPGNRKVVNVRYKGDVPALTDLMGDNIQLIWTTGRGSSARSSRSSMTASAESCARTTSSSNSRGNENERKMLARLNRQQKS
jgi:tripartite-type tricarboxylate transporter receptor subunit TctC